MRAVAANLRWEFVRLVRSQRVFLLAIPPVAGPIGSVLAFLYLQVPSYGVAIMLGLFVTGGLGGLVVLDLSALSMGEELSRRSHLISWALPQARWEILFGRAALTLGASLGAFSLGALILWVLTGHLTFQGSALSTAVLDPGHLFIGMLALLFFLGAITLCASVITRSASEALVAGVLGAVVTASIAGYFLLQHQLTMLFPVVLVVAGIVALAWAAIRLESLEDK